MVLALSVLAALLSIPVSAGVVNFPDPGLEAAIRDAIAKPTGDILDSDLLGLTHLDAGRRNIASLEGIQYCIDLTELGVYSNQIVDIGPLSGLTNLTMLWLGSNQIADISPLSSLTKLATLHLGGNEIIDIRPLEGLTNLTQIELGDNKIIDIQALAGLINLTHLNLSENEIVDIQGLVDNLGVGAEDFVDIRFNYLDLTLGSPDTLNVEALEAREVLVEQTPQNPPRTAVNFPDPEFRAAIRDAIAKPTGDIHDTDLIGLMFLDINDWGVTNPEGIQYCVDLVELGLWENEIVDIGVLAVLTDLTLLNLCRNEIFDISPLSDLTNLTILSLYRNEIADISALSGLTNLTELYLDENQIVDIQALVDNPGLDEGDVVDVRYNYLDLTPGSPDMLNIEALQDRGVRVDFDPQN